MKVNVKSKICGILNIVYILNTILETDVIYDIRCHYCISLYIIRHHTYTTFK